MNSQLSLRDAQRRTAASALLIAGASAGIATLTLPPVAAGLGVAAFAAYVCSLRVRINSR